MSFLNFENALGKFQNLTTIDSALPKEFKYGIKYDVEYNIQSVGDTFGTRKGALFSNVATQLGRVDVVFTRDQDVYDGIDASVISPQDGRPDPDLLAASFGRQWDNDKRLTLSRINSLRRYQRENSVTILYNLLRLMYIRQIQIEKSNMVIRKDDVYYDDGHIVVNNSALFDMDTDWAISTFEFPQPKHVQPAKIDGELEWGMNQSAHSPELYGYGICIDQLNERDVFLIRTAAGAWTSSSPLRLFHKCPTVLRQISSFNYTNKAISLNEQLNMADFSPEDILITINKFVTTHRLNTHFDMAYAILVQVLYTHKPRSAESLIWTTKPQVLSLPYPGMMRGAVPSLLAGSPFVTDVTRWSTFSNWLAQPSRCAYHSIGLSEAVHVSNFEYITRMRPDPKCKADKKLKDPLDIYIGSNHLIGCGLIRDMHLLSMRLGTSVTAPWATSIGLHRYQDMYDDLSPQYVQVQVRDEGAYDDYSLKKIDHMGVSKAYLPLTSVVPCVYPLLTMGITKSDYYMSQLEHNVKLEYNRARKVYMSTDHKMIHRACMMLRLAGYDCKVKRVSDQKVFNNWAPNHDGHYLPSFTNNGDPYEQYELDPRTIIQRHNHWVDLPTLAEQLSIDIKLTYRTVVRMYDGEVVNEPMVTFAIRKVSVNDDVKPTTGDHIAFVELGIKTPGAIEDYQDFLVAHHARVAVAFAALDTQVRAEIAIGMQEVDHGGGENQ